MLGSTGNVSITGLGFKPGKIHFNPIHASSTSAAQLGWGAADEALNQYAVGSFVTNSGSVGMVTDQTCCILTLAGISTVYQKAKLVSMDSDGFTLNVLSAGTVFDVPYEADA